MGQVLRILLVVIGIGLILMVLRQALSHRRPSARPRESVQEMVRCAHCGVHVPRSEAVFEESTPFCSDEHRGAGARN
jgi:uncharacterized protein